MKSVYRAAAGQFPRAGFLTLMIISEAWTLKFWCVHYRVGMMTFSWNDGCSQPVTPKVRSWRLYTRGPNAVESDA